MRKIAKVMRKCAGNAGLLKKVDARFQILFENGENPSKQEIVIAVLITLACLSVIWTLYSENDNYHHVIRKIVKCPGRTFMR